MSSRGRKKCSYEGCGARRFYEGDDGYNYCDQGHQQSERGTATTSNAGELVVEGRKHKTKNGETGSATSRASGLTGPKALERYLLCLQLVIWKQVRWLIDVRKLPAELETLAHDLWALRLQQVASRVSYDFESETEAAASQVFSSQSEGDASHASTGTRRSKRSSNADTGRKESAPNLLDAVALSYVALLLLREPVTVADLYSWMKDGHFPYYHAVHEIPLSMRERLPGTYQELLEPPTIVRARRLQNVIQSLLNTFSSTLGMAFPHINHPLILYRWTREMVLPIECYAGTKRLAQLLSIDFSITTSTLPWKVVALRSPEVRLMALLIVATKLLFPFDDIRRYPSSASDLSALKLEWSAWADAVYTQRSSEPSNEFAKNLDIPSSDIQNLSDEKLDNYLDWYESNIATEDVRANFNSKGTKDDTDFRRTLFELFPPGNPSTRQKKGKAKAQETSTLVESTQQALRTVQAGLKPKQIVPIATRSSTGDPSDINRTGSFYQRYRRVDDLPVDGKMPVRLFYEIAAEKSGVELEDLVRAVLAIEIRLEKVEERLRRKSKSKETDVDMDLGMMGMESEASESA